MAKKKAAPVVYYTPPSPPQQVKDIINDEIQQIPAYEDSGVRYQGKYKKQISQKEYSLKNQNIKQYMLTIWSGGFLSTVTRTTGKRFFCTGAYIQSTTNLFGAAIQKQLLLYDGNYLTDGRIVWADMKPSAALSFEVFLTFNTPLEFNAKSNVINLTSSYNYSGVSEAATVILYGFEEEI